MFYTAVVFAFEGKSVMLTFNKVSVAEILTLYSLVPLDFRVIREWNI